MRRGAGLQVLHFSSLRTRGSRLTRRSSVVSMRARRSRRSAMSPSALEDARDILEPPLAHIEQRDPAGPGRDLAGERVGYAAGERAMARPVKLAQADELLPTLLGLKHLAGRCRLPRTDNGDQAASKRRVELDVVLAAFARERAGCGPGQTARTVCKRKMRPEGSGRKCARERQCFLCERPENVTASAISHTARLVECESSRVRLRLSCAARPSRRRTNGQVYRILCTNGEFPFLLDSDRECPPSSADALIEFDHGVHVGPFEIRKFHLAGGRQIKAQQGQSRAAACEQLSSDPVEQQAHDSFTKRSPLEYEAFLCGCGLWGGGHA